EAGSLGPISEVANDALTQHLPTMADDRGFAGRMMSGLMTYGPSSEQQARRAAEYVDKILSGADPAGLPVEQPNQFDFTINRQTARTLGLTIPQSVILQTTELI